MSNATDGFSDRTEHRPDQGGARASRKPIDLSSGWCGFGWFKPVVGTPEDESSRAISEDDADD